MATASLGASLRQTPLTCSGHTRPVVDLAFSDITECGYFLISACKDGKPMLRQGDTGDWIGTFEGHKGAVWGATLNKDASRAATGAADFSAKIWDAVTGDELHSLVHKHIVKAVSFSGDMSKLLTGSQEKILRIYDLNQIDAEASTLSGHTGGIPSCLWLNDGRRVVSSSDDKTVRLWDTVSKETVNKLTLPDAPCSLELSRDSTILTVPHGNTVGFYKSDTFEKIKEFELPSRIFSASMHPDQTTFVCGGEDFKMYKFDYNTGTEIESFKGHFGPVHRVRFSPDGELYASGSEDGTLRLWQTTVGKTYGLWKCVMPEELTNNLENNGPIMKPEA